MLDMHTREKVNKIHLEEMHREAKSRPLLRNAGPTQTSASTTAQTECFYSDTHGSLLGAI
jgi:hypothetical protein